MYSHRIKILNGTNNNDITDIIPEKLELVFFPAHDAFLDEYFVDR